MRESSTAKTSLFPRCVESTKNLKQHPSASGIRNLWAVFRLFDTTRTSGLAQVENGTVPTRNVMNRLTLDDILSGTFRHTPAVPSVAPYEMHIHSFACIVGSAAASDPDQVGIFRRCCPSSPVVRSPSDANFRQSGASSKSGSLGRSMILVVMEQKVRHLKWESSQLPTQEHR